MHAAHVSGGSYQSTCAHTANSTGKDHLALYKQPTPLTSQPPSPQTLASEAHWHSSSQPLCSCFHNSKTLGAILVTSTPHTCSVAPHDTGAHCTFIPSSIHVERPSAHDYMQGYFNYITHFQMAKPQHWKWSLNSMISFTHVVPE